MDELIRKLEERRAKLTARGTELLNLAGARENLKNTDGELAEYGQIETDLGETVRVGGGNVEVGVLLGRL